MYFERTGLSTLTNAGHTQFIGNTATTSGGAIYAAGALTLDGTGTLSFSGNTAPQGGAIYAVGNLTLDTGITFESDINTDVWTPNVIINTGAILAFDLEKATAATTNLRITGAVDQQAANTTVSLAEWNVGTFTLMTATGGGIDHTKYTVDPSSFGSRQTAILSGNANTLIVTTTSSGNRDIVWTGGSNGNWNTTTTNNWHLAGTPTTAEMFNPDDFVTFTAAPTRKNVTLTSNAQVSGMRVTGGEYTFSGGEIHGFAHTSTGQTVTGKLEITGGSAMFNNNVSFVNGIEVGNATLGGSGTLTTAGNAIFANSATLVFDIHKTGALLIADGNVSIGSGAILNVSGRGKKDQEYLVIQAGSFTGAFTPGDASAFSLFLKGTDELWIRWLLGSPDFADAIRRIGTPNAIRAAEGMDAIYENGFDGNLADLCGALEAISNPQALADAFAMLHGEVFASNKESAVRLQRGFLQRLPSARERLLCGELCVGEWNRWATFTGDWQGRGKIGQYSGYDMKTAGVAGGIDRHVRRNLMFGVAFGGDYVSQEFRSIHSQNKMDVFRLALYGGWWSGTNFANAYAGYTGNQQRTQRNIDIDNTFNAVAKSQYVDHMFSTGLEFGRALHYGFTPSVGMHYIYLGSPSVIETGGGDANLLVHRGRYHSLRVPMGTKWNYSVVGETGIVWTRELRAFYVRELADDVAWARTSFDGVRDVSFLAAGGSQGRNSGRLGLGLNVGWSESVNFRFDYDCEVFAHTTTSEFGASAAINW